MPDLEHLLGIGRVGADRVELGEHRLPAFRLGQGLGDDLQQLLGLLPLQERGGEGPIALGGRLRGEQGLVEGLGLVELARLAVAVGQGVLERDVLRVDLGRLLEPGRDLGLALQGLEDLGEELVPFDPLRLALEVALDDGQGLVPLAGLLERLGELERELGVVRVVDEAALEGLDGLVVPLGLEEDEPEVEVGPGLVRPQDPPLVGRREPVGGLVVERLDDEGEGVGGLVDLLEPAGVELPELEFGQEAARRRPCPARGCPGPPGASPGRPPGPSS